ncbi:MAG: ABC transporter permease [Phycisphaerales bacterium]
MSRALAIARREFTSYFTTPVGYVVIALFLFVSGYLFWLSVLSTGVEATMRGFFSITMMLLLFIAPAISMRLLSEELRLGTIETLMTCPISDAQVVIGKWLAALGFFLAMLAPTLVFVLTLAIYADPDFGPIFSGYLGLALVGSLYLALGALASTFWASQILSYLLALFFWLAFFGVTNWLPRSLPDPWSDMLYWMSIFQRYDDSFGKGVIDLGSVVYFLSGTVLFLAIAIKTLEVRRWR